MVKNNKTYRALLSPLVVAGCLTLPQPGLGQGADSGRIAGVVTIEGGGLVEGVLVKIEGSDQQAYTDANGRYVLRGLEPGTYNLVFQYVGLPEVTRSVTVQPGASAVSDARISDPLEEIVVTAKLLAQNTERASFSKKSIIQSDKIGKFPDYNAAEALQRLPGINVDNDRGEGRFVSVRGAPSSFNRVKLNGLSLGSPESNGLGVPLDIFPAAQLSKIEVSKAVLPEQDANSVGGEINLSFPTAFGSDPRTFLSLNAGETDLDSGDRYGFSGLHARTFGDNDQFGITIAGQFSKRDIKAETIEAGGWDDIGGNTFAVESTELRDQRVERENEGYSVVLEWKPNEETRLYFSASNNQFDELEIRNRFITPFDEASDITNQTVVDAGDGSSTVLQGDYEGVVEMVRTWQRDFTPQEVEVLAFGGEMETGDWKFDWVIGSNDTEELRVRKRLEFRQGDSGTDEIPIDVTYDGRSPLTPTITYGAGAFDPATYGLRRVRLRQNDRFDSVDTLAFNVTRYLIVGDNTLDLKFGLRITDRERENDEEDPEWVSEAIDYTLADFAGPELGNLVDGQYRYGPGVRDDAFATLFASDLVDDSDPNDALVDDYVADERIIAYYIQGNYRWGNHSLLGGVRFEQTDLEITGNSLLESTESTIVETFKNDYSNSFPSLHYRWDINDELVFRASWTNTIRRPSFNDLSPAREIDDESLPVEIEQGNPDLKPFESENVDLSLDWYSEDYGVFGLAYFNKDIDNFIVEITETGVDTGTFIDAEVERPINAESGEIDGVEFNWSKQLPYGFGIDFNYAIVNSDVKFPATGEGARDNGETERPLEGQSDKTGNLSLTYTYDNLFTQVSFKHTGPRINSYEDSFVDEVEGWRRTVDVKATYSINDNYEVEFLARNITDEPKRTFIGDGASRLREYEVNGRWIQLGLRINF